MKIPPNPCELLRVSGELSTREPLSKSIIFDSSDFVCVGEGVRVRTSGFEFHSVDMSEVGTTGDGWKENTDLPSYLKLRCYKFDRKYEDPGVGDMKFSNNSPNGIYSEIAEMPEPLLETEILIPSEIQTSSAIFVFHQHCASPQNNRPCEVLAKVMGARASRRRVTKNAGRMPAYPAKPAFLSPACRTDVTDRMVFQEHRIA